MKISFDIDGVLDTPQAHGSCSQEDCQWRTRVYYHCTKRAADGEEVYTRKRARIPRLRVYFTNGADKWKTIQSLGIELHIDNKF